MPLRSLVCKVCLLTALLPLAAPGSAQTTPSAPESPPTIASAAPAPDAPADFEKRIVMIPMRDGVKLNTVIVVKNGTKSAPIILTRTPYNAAGRAERAKSPSMAETLPLGDGVFVNDAYIRVFQDIRGKHGSEGEYEIVRPLRGPLNDTATDHSTDAFDTIDWLVKNVPESNGRVGMLGSSYEGFTVVNALVNPHPALKVAAPMSPMVDGWMGDDWFHYGAFRQNSMDYFAGQCSARGSGRSITRTGYDDYDNFLRVGSAGDFAKRGDLEALKVWRQYSAHPAYDEFWQQQALDKTMAQQPLTVPTMWIQGIWDQEDMWGGIHCYWAVEPKDSSNSMNFLVLGPWRHSGVNYDGSSLGPLTFGGDTALEFRRDVLKPFFDQYLKEDAATAQTPPVLIYNTGDLKWDRLPAWPRSCESGCEFQSKPLYLQSGFGLSFTAPSEGAASAPNSYAEFVSDPAKPVPYVPVPTRFDDGDLWKRWLLTDQRSVSTRTDVLSFVGEVLTEEVRVSGEPRANLVASTSGTDSDWVVKLIDVYPDVMSGAAAMGGYQMPVSMDIFRGRYREGFDKPMAITPGKPLVYRFDLPTVNHVFKPGHRIMVQIQSSWFPLYDRNPQTFVPNIFFGKPEDYVKATQRIFHAPGAASFVELPVVDGE